MLKFWENISVITIAIVTIACITTQLVVLGFSIYMHSNKPPVEDNSQTEVEYLMHQIQLSDSVIQTWEDHAVRVK